MKEWREYTSEDDASWEIFCDSEIQELQEDLISRNGNEAIMRSIHKSADYISVTILPRAREIDSITHKLHFENKFHLLLECLDEGITCLSTDYFSSKEALELAASFVGLRKNAAFRVWKAKRLGPLSTRIEKE